MSIDINWDTLTKGEDGAALAETIREFIDDRFQKVTLPRMIRSVKVHSFDFGSVPPSIELKDVCDPLPDFYEGDEDDAEDTDHNGTGGGHENERPDDQNSIEPLHNDKHSRDRYASGPADRDNNYSTGLHHQPFFNHQLASLRDMGSPMLSRAPTPGILGGTSNVGYFHLPLSAGLSGTTTPLAAVAGAQFHNARHEYDLARSSENNTNSTAQRHRSTSFGSPTPSSTTTPSSRPTSRHQMDWPEDELEHSTDGHASPRRNSQVTEQERSGEDVQMVFHLSYSGDVRLSLTAEILLDYPMPSFVGIPLQLNITGLTFDGVGILAYIKKKAHFCFLCPEDAEALVGASMTGEHDVDDSSPSQHQQRPTRLGALLEEIKVESEIGQREGGKQVLKNVGKVEKFVLEQVRRIFDDEFVYPSFWTFLV
ncbi:hypothetical protein MBLNU459_g3753t1 [Dothideomycetes sp. NU459]